MADNTEYHLRCSSCGATNRLLSSRLGQSPTCGKCKQQLFSESSPIQSGAIVLPCQHCQTSNKVPLKKIDDQPLCGKCKSQISINLASQPGPLILTDQNFTESVLRSPVPVLVNFYSPDCGPCKLLSPTINKIATDYEGRLKVGNFNVDINQYIPSLYRVGGTPTLLLFRASKELRRLEGYHPSGTITQWIHPHAW